MIDVVMSVAAILFIWSIIGMCIGILLADVIDPYSNGKPFIEILFIFLFGPVFWISACVVFGQERNIKLREKKGV